VLVAVALFYGALLHAGTVEGEARAAAFMALLVSNFALILAIRQPRAMPLRRALAGGRALAAMATATAAMLGAVLAIAPLRRLFGFELPSPAAALAAAGVGLAVLASLALARRTKTSAQ
jgi:P-type Ca2+ transporter type 2C